jgi:hypothetical protein
MQGVLAATLLATSVFVPVAEARPFRAPYAGGRAERRVASEAFVRTELFFGSARPDGTEITEEEFRGFLDEEITPRFPDGLTLLTGFGQFRDSTNTIVRERSFVLILLYPTGSRKSSDEKIEAIREAYKDRFQQESVLRVDDKHPARVSF